MFAGGCEELDWTLSVLFDAMGAMATKFNATPATASRAYDKNRDGFVIAGGAGVVVLEELRARQGPRRQIYGEVVGYGATSTASIWSRRRARGRCAACASPCRRGSRPIDYINPHAPRRRSATSRRSRRSARCSARARMPADLGDQVADRPFARRHRRAGGDLLPADDEQRLHLRERQYRGARSGGRRHERSSASASTTPGSTRSCPTPSASAAPMPPPTLVLSAAAAGRK